nr:WhiB family transcriptional regulator [Rhodococcus sp. 06-621-2]
MRASASTSDRNVGWRQAASCNSYDTDIFFSPDAEDRTAKARREMLAKRICHGCPVLMACRAEAVLSRERFGVWGGLTETERRYLKRPYSFGAHERHISATRTSLL